MKGQLTKPAPVDPTVDRNGSPSMLARLLMTAPQGELEMSDGLPQILEVSQTLAKEFLQVLSKPDNINRGTRNSQVKTRRK